VQLLFKPDWEEAKERYKAWWAHEVLDRCALWVTAPKADPAAEPPPPLPTKVEDRWLDLDYVAAANDYQMRHTYYGAEAFPVWSPGYPGWTFIPCYMGAPVTLSEDTGWVAAVACHARVLRGAGPG